MSENDANKDFELNGDFWVVELERSLTQLHQKLEELERNIRNQERDYEYLKKDKNNTINFLLEQLYKTGSKKFGKWEDIGHRDFVKCSNCGDTHLPNFFCQTCGSINNVEMYLCYKKSSKPDDELIKCMQELQEAQEKNGVEGEK